MGRDVIFEASRYEREGETFFTGRLAGRDTILVFFDPAVEPGPRTALNGVEVSAGSHGLKLCPATYDNVLAFERQVAGPRLVALNKAGYRSGLGTGNRVIVAWDDGACLGDPASLGVFAGIFQATVKSGVSTWFIQQSIVRELIPEGIDPKAHLGLGHTGGYGPRELLRAGLFALASLGGYGGNHKSKIQNPKFVGADADHAIVTGETEEELAASLALNKTAIAESRDYTKFTVDTSRLFGFPVSLSAGDRKRLLKVFRGRTFVVSNVIESRPGFEYTFADEEISRLGQKYWRACQVHKELYDFILDLKGDVPFDYELSLDETPAPTEPKELLFYMATLEEVMGLPRGGVCSCAPNFGFRKRADYQGDIEVELKPLVNECASIAAAFDQVLCFHSGSGMGVETGKGQGVDQALAEATGGCLQLKVSGIYQEILWRVLAESPDPAERALFEKAWAHTYRIAETLSRVYVALIAGRDQAEAQALLADESRVGKVAGREAIALVKQTLGYGLHQAALAHDLLGVADPSHRHPADDFFRHLSYLAFRPLRAELYRTITPDGWQHYADAVTRYTRMRIAGLGMTED